MKDLKKIAQDEQMTYLQKVAAIVDEFAAGNVTGEEADAIANDAGIASEDLLAVHTAAYGEEDIEKVASADKIADEAAADLVKVAEDADSTYLQKCAGIADAYAAGAVTAEEGDKIAVELGLSPDDVAAVFTSAYSDELEKEASAEDELSPEAVEAGETLTKIAGDAESTYLQKCAGVADAMAEGAITVDEGIEISDELELELDDVASVIGAAHGEDLGKEAAGKFEAFKKGAKEFGGKAADKAKKYSGYDDIKEAISKNKAIKENATAGSLGARDTRINKLVEKRNNAAKAGAGKASAVAAGTGAAGYGASKLFGKKED